MPNVLDLSAADARKYFLQSSNYCGIDIPNYFNFQEILDFVKDKIRDRQLGDCEEESPANHENASYRLLTNKDGRYAYRPLQLVNPYLYYFLVREITEETNWAFLRKRILEDFKKDNIEVFSIPLLKDDRDKGVKATTIKSWWEHVEQRSIELSLEYKYVFITDITNCYGSIYTHSIPWALYGKETAKRNRRIKNLGYYIDEYIRFMQYGQTNGIPQGSALFDFIAEIVLGYADLLLYEELKPKEKKEDNEEESNNNEDGEGKLFGTDEDFIEEDWLSEESYKPKDIKIGDYKILRYRDDYRIFSNSKEEIEIIAMKLQSILAGLNFQINSSKTTLKEEIVEASVKPDKLYYLSNVPIHKGQETLFTTLQKELLYILSFSRKYPNSGTVMRLLDELLDRVDGLKDCKENTRVLTAIAAEIAMNSPKAYGYVISVISHFIFKSNLTLEEREEVVKNVYNKFCRLPNIGHLQIWMQRMTYEMEIEYSEQLCKIANNFFKKLPADSTLSIWDNDWLKREFVERFPTFSLCTQYPESPVIGKDEASVFGKRINY